MKPKRGIGAPAAAVPTRRMHGSVVSPPARRAIERAGWRTRLEYYERRRRSTTGALLGIDERWTAEAQRFDGEIASVSATAASPELAWSAVFGRIERGEVTYHRRVRLA